MAGSAAEAYIRFWETLSPDSLERLSEIAAPNIRFADPFNDVQGLDRFRAVFDDMFRRVGTPRFRVTDHATSGDLSFLKWVFTFRGGGRDWRIEGVSEIRFDEAGLVIEHIDHWDAAGQLYERLPVLGAILRMIRRRSAG
jgi:hypothetical protein